MLAHEFKLEIETRELYYVIKKKDSQQYAYLYTRIARFTRRFSSSFFALKSFESVQLGKWNLKFKKKNFFSVKNIKRSRKKSCLKYIF